MNKSAFLLALVCAASTHAQQPPEFSSNAHEKWHAQKIITSDFAFEVLIRSKEYDDSTLMVQAIRVIERKSGNIFQQFDDVGGMEFRGTLTDVVRVMDADLNGYPDFSFPTSDGGASPNFTNNFYIFNVKRGRFELNEELSMLPQAGIDANGIVFSEGRASCCHHYSSTYRLRNGKLYLIDSTDSYTPPGD